MQMQKPCLISAYHWLGPRREEDVIFEDVFEWVDQRGSRSDLLAIWPAQRDSERKRVEAEDADAQAGEKQLVDAEEMKRRDKPTTMPTSGPTNQIPLRLYDCTDGILKDQETYLQETNNIVPPYLVVSQVWGEIKELMNIPTVDWGVPISDRRKWDVILGYCRREGVRWLWIDILCINQTRDSLEANREKALEIPKMSSYYREATACLVIPDRYESFSDWHKEVMGLHSEFAHSNVLDSDSTLRIWNSIEMLRSLIQDAWFGRVWTVQELLLPKKLVLFDGQVLEPSRILLALDWYHVIVRRGILRKPASGKDYPFVHPKGEIVLAAFGHGNMNDGLKKVLRQKGYIDLVHAVDQTRWKLSTKAEDRLFALYGLISEEEKVPVEISSDSQVVSTSGVAEGVAADTMVLRLKWKETMWKALSTGRVWPLLYDALDPNDVGKGMNWMPRITVPQDLWFGPLATDTIDYTNHHAVHVSDEGLHIAARKVGHVIGTSVLIGGGGGELNKAIACIWILMAKGFDIEPIMGLLKHVLAHPESVRDALPPGAVEVSQMALQIALNATSLQECFQIYEEAGLREKVVHHGGFCGWNRRILCLELEAQSRPLVCWAWIHASMQLDRENCWVLDVTSEPADSVQRWVVVNRVGPSAYSKIGTVCAHPVGLKDSFVRVVLD
ncbi:hypothetical protein BV22DRAFT_1079017 [Leucogyrophana mollusca]|uniref:Uncharacterized protein n=1 Tax=Leucogyrophana mollusca TaxID=85980 RepID=A0ACB8BYW7_9AGAM|nr:hypothetical protein BV22DRAFT_1079017 [Leucogyrophana mollusca]